jgi:hypothetical protein
MRPAWLILVEGMVASRRDSRSSAVSPRRNHPLYAPSLARDRGSPCRPRTRLRCLRVGGLTFAGVVAQRACYSSTDPCGPSWTSELWYTPSDSASVARRSRPRRRPHVGAAPWPLRAKTPLPKGNSAALAARASREARRSLRARTAGPLRPRPVRQRCRPPAYAEGVGHASPVATPWVTRTRPSLAARDFLTLKASDMPAHGQRLGGSRRHAHPTP